MEQNEFAILAKSLALGYGLLFGAAGLFILVIAALAPPLQPTLWPNLIGMLIFSVANLAVFRTTPINRPPATWKIFLLLSYFVLCGVYQLVLTDWLNLGYLYLFLSVLTAAILLTFNQTVILFSLSVLVMFSVVYAESSGFIFPTIFTQNSLWNGTWLVVGLTGLTLFFVATTYLNFANRVFTARRKRRKSLQTGENDLESTVEYETFSLNIANQVNRTISRQIDSDRLIIDVVNQVKASFNYDHVQIYLLDHAKKELVIAGGTGDPGTALMIAEHRIPMGIGLVGEAAHTQEPVIIYDVTDNAQWLPNPLLPNTQAEVSIPIIYGDEVLGVLDIQHDEPTFTSENVSLLKVVASQLGIALNNVNIFNEIETKVAVDSEINNLALQLQIAQDINTTIHQSVKAIHSLFNPHQVHVTLSPELIDIKPANGSPRNTHNNGSGG